MTSSSLPFGLGLGGIGAILITSGVTGNSLSQILQGDFTRSTSSTTSTTTTPTGTVTSTTTPTTAQVNSVTPPESPSMIANGIPTYPSLANKSLSWLLANGYTKNAKGQVVKT